MSPFNVYCQFDPLEEIWVGDCYPESFFADLAPEVRDTFCKVAEITHRDLDHLSDVLRSLGVTVRRPDFTDNPDDYKDTNGNLYRPPITPRDDNLVLGNTFYHLRTIWPHNPWQSAVHDYESACGSIIKANQLERYGYLAAPAILRLGRDILIDIDTHRHCWHLIERDCIPEWVSQGYRVMVSDTAGHTDSVFAVMRPGHIMTSHWKIDYESEFPGWDIFRIPFKKTSNPFVQNVGKSACWWVEELGVTVPTFNEHVAKFASDWIGYPLETVFTVNCLVVNEQLVLTSGTPDQDLQQWLKKIGMEWIPIRLDSGTFWDAGVHCFTCDIRRQGGMRDLFPDRTGSILRFAEA